jgi:hypothetical protein
MTIAMKFPPVVEHALVPSSEKTAEESRQAFAKLVFATVMAAGYASALMAFLYPFVYYYYTYTPY